MFAIILLVKAGQMAKPRVSVDVTTKRKDREGTDCSHFCKQSPAFDMASVLFRILIWFSICSIPQKEVPKK